MTGAREDIRRGDLFWIDWSPGRGSEQAGRRPGLVVQTDTANRNVRYPNTMVVAVSRSGRDIPSHVFLLPSPESGLSEGSYAKCEQVQTISKERLEERIGRVAADELHRVSLALKRMLALP